MTPKLVPSRDGSHIYLLAASPSGEVRVFDTSTLEWESPIPAVPGMADIDIGFQAFTCAGGQCFGGPALAVGENDVLHVVWGDRGFMACDPDAQVWTSVRVMHTQYDGSSWSEPETITSRQGETDPECGDQYPNVAEDGTGNLSLSHMHGRYLGPNNWLEGVHYHTYTPANGWRYRERISLFPQWSEVTGGFGRLLLGYALPSQDHVAEIDPETGAVLLDEQISSQTSAPKMLLAAADDLHVVLGNHVHQPTEHTGAVYYIHKTAEGWEFGESQLVTDDAEIFVAPPEGTEAPAVTPVAVGPGGRRLMTFSYSSKLYFVTYDRSACSAPVAYAAGNTVSTQAVVSVNDPYYLVVWSTGLEAGSESWWTLVPTGIEPPEAVADGGPEGGGGGALPDAGTGGSGGSTPTQPTGSEDDGGCGCRAPGSRAGTDGAWLVAGLGALCARGLRRRARLA